MGIQRIYIAERMMILTVFIAVFTQVLFENEICIKKGYTVLAKCIVVAQQQQQPSELSSDGSSEAIDKRISNENVVETSSRTACYYCNSDAFRDSYDDQYQIRATLYIDNEKVFENITDVESRWTKIISEATEAHQAKHYKQSLIMSQRPIVKYSDQGINVKILKTECSTELCTQTFVVLYHNEPISAEIIVSDLSLLSLSRISARLQLPVESISTLSLNDGKQSQWWIVAVVIGVAISIIAIGWLCLFIYYNSCGRPYAIMNEKTSTSAIFRKDKFIQTSENDDGSKFSNIQSRAFTESDKEKNSQNISVDCTSLGTTQKRVKDATGTDVISNVAAMAASETDDNEREMKSASQETFDYPMSIVTRPRRKDLITQKLELLNDLPLPVMKEIWKEDTPHPHPMPPTVSGILEVRNFTEQPHTNPMNCL